MNQISWRHHYIPQFYLNGFTSINGHFKIYDVQKKDFIKNGKDFYPESFFFEKDGNSMITENGKADFIEDSFKKMDSKAAEVFNRINNSTSKEKFNIDEKDIALLQYFIGIMYWRIPTNFDEIKNIVESKRFKEIGLKVVNLEGEIIDDSEFEKRLKTNDNFFKAMKFYFPCISYPEIFNCKTHLHIIPTSQGLPSICSDNPIICRNPETFRVYSDDFIFPLTSTKLFIRGEKLIDFMNTVRIEIDLLTYKQAKKYVSCTDEKYIEELEKMYQKSNKNLDDLRFSIFKQILNYAT